LRSTKKDRFLRSMFINSQENVHVASVDYLSTSIVCVNLHYAVSAYENVGGCQHWQNRIEQV
jgi:hypothetical protein